MRSGNKEIVDCRPVNFQSFVSILLPREKMKHTSKDPSLIGQEIEHDHHCENVDWIKHSRPISALTENLIH